MLVLIPPRLSKMVGNGLIINEDEFMGLKSKEQNLILYRNTTAIFKLVKGYKLYYKITTIVGSVLIIGMGILFRFHLGG